MPYDAGLADRVRSILNRRQRFSERAMFGGLAFLMNGHMCCGVSKTDLVLRLSPEGVVQALRRPHTRPMDFTGRPMKSMVFVGAEGTVADSDLHGWVDSAVAFVRSLPPKKETPGKRRTSGPR